MLSLGDEILFCSLLIECIQIKIKRRNKDHNRLNEASKQIKLRHFYPDIFIQYHIISLIIFMTLYDHLIGPATDLPVVPIR